ncbi:MAG: hypothetical protein MUE68_12420 [Bacteroidetes bacterium]|jgi:hypothetical protein|nr:hypothetical protein [Bacteroidota bacterium]
MKNLPWSRIVGVILLILLAAVVIFAQDNRVAVVDLRDFTDVEVRAAGFSLSRDLDVRVTASGGGERSLIREMIDDDENSGMYAYGWIIDASTRDVVWQMDLSNTSGRRNRRAAEDKVRLKAGAYEVYYAAWGYVRSSGFSYSSANIDRREPDRRGSSVISIFGRDFEDLRDEFMELAKDEWGIEVDVDAKDAGAVKPFKAPAPFRQTLVSAVCVGDKALIRKTITVARDVPVRIYALGEGRDRDELFDHGWLLDVETRRRIWDMRGASVGQAGGARKNLLSDVDLTLEKGTYELVYVTDDTHSSDDWNDRPPTDPLAYGVTVFLEKESDRSAVKVEDGAASDKGLIVEIVRVGDDAFKNASFALKKETKIHVYALGERSNDGKLADHGWIIDANTREKVWRMEDRRSVHAGGASKNRLVDEIITLPAGSYTVYYQTDDSHSYDDWNSGMPMDPERWGITLRGAGKEFDPKAVSTVPVAAPKNLVAEIVRVRDDRHERQRFSLAKATRVRIVAVGEGSGDDMADYGWIEEASSRRVVWEMTYRMTDHAGGARKNRSVNTRLTLEPGDYVLHYRTDDTHAFGDWNSDPPDDPEAWGIRVVKEE